MQVSTIRIKLLAAAAAVAVFGAAVAPAAGKYWIPEEPGLEITRVKQPVREERARRAVVSVGWSSRYGFELYAPAGGGVRMG